MEKICILGIIFYKLFKNYRALPIGEDFKNREVSMLVVCNLFFFFFFEHCYLFSKGKKPYKIIQGLEEDYFYLSNIECAIENIQDSFRLDSQIFIKGSADRLSEDLSMLENTTAISSYALGLFKNYFEENLNPIELLKIVYKEKSEIMRYNFYKLTDGFLKNCAGLKDFIQNNKNLSFILKLKKCEKIDERNKEGLKINESLICDLEVLYQNFKESS